MSHEELKARDRDRLLPWVSPSITPLNCDSEDGFFFEQLAGKIITFSSTPLFLIDSETGIVLQCSEPAEELLREPLGIKGRPYSAITLIPPVAGVGPGRFESVLQREDGSFVPVEVSLSSFEVGKRSFILSTFRDISDLKRTESLLDETEKSLRHMQKMEAIGTLAGGIAHEFNNILAAIIGYTEMSVQDNREKKDIQGNLNHIFSASLRAKDLIKQILTFSRQAEQNLMPVNLNPVIKEAVRMLRATLPRNIDIKQNIRSDAGIVKADPIQIHQVLMNLCTNALNAMAEKGGTLSIELSGRTIGQDELAYLPGLAPGSYLQLVVGDTGCGMTPDVLERIFEPFFKTSQSGQGPGMGLAVVYGIVKKHGGNIGVESRLNTGTTFRIFLPVLKPDARADYERLVQNMPQGSERILFVDDEENLTALAARMLERLGYSVVTQTSSIEALKLFTTQPDGFDLVITDQSMPNLSGLQLAAELKKIRKKIPIILCTGFNESVFSEKGRSEGIHEVIQKPLVMHEMASVIRRVLDSE